MVESREGWKSTPTLTPHSCGVCFPLSHTHLFPRQGKAFAHWPCLEESRWVPLPTGPSFPDKAGDTQAWGLMSVLQDTTGLRSSGYHSQTF